MMILRFLVGVGVAVAVYVGEDYIFDKGGGLGVGTNQLLTDAIAGFKDIAR
jgi:hypothetical protein